MVIASPEQRTNGPAIPQQEPPTAAGPTPAQPAAGPAAAGQAASGQAASGQAASGPIRVWFLPDVAVGATAGAVGAIGALLGAAGRAAARTAPSRADAGRLGARVGRRITGLADRGAVQRQRGQRFAVTVVDAASTTVVTSAMVNRAVDLQLNRVLRPVVAAVLDDVLARLEAEPERVRSLVRGQRESMVDEIVGRVRAGALAGDTTVERWTTRILRRSTAPAAPVAPVAPPAPDPSPTL
jgi:hypothetical protein